VTRVARRLALRRWKDDCRPPCLPCAWPDSTINPKESVIPAHIPADYPHRVAQRTTRMASVVRGTRLSICSVSGEANCAAAIAGKFG
jgi:hypothetical protein